MQNTKLDKRSLVRVRMMKILYTADLNNVDIFEANKILSENDIEDEKEDPINEKELNEYVSFINENLNKIDEIISNSLVGYKINRLNLVDKSIVRVATAEMLMNKLAKTIIINEALEITKLYSDLGDHKAVSFNNKLLDNISKNI